MGATHGPQHATGLGGHVLAGVAHLPANGQRRTKERARPCAAAWTMAWQSPLVRV